MNRRSYPWLLLTIATFAVATGSWLVADAPDPDKGNVDEVRFGTTVDAQGVVPKASHAKHFVPGAVIHATMDVKEAPKDTPLLINVLDRETEELVWSEEQKVPGGHAKMHFVIDKGKLQPGKYRAKIKLGNDWVAEHEFEVS